MDTDNRQRPEDTERRDRRADEESVEEFRREMEEDPSRAPADDENLERARGG